MTIAQFIEELKRLPQDHELVYIDMHLDEYPIDWKYKLETAGLLLIPPEEKK